MSAESSSGSRIAIISFPHHTADGTSETAALRDTLTALGHDPFKIDFNGNLRTFIDLLEFNKPEVAINLCRSTPAFPMADVAVPGILDLLNISYTGPDPHTVSLMHDRHAALRQLMGHSIPLNASDPPPASDVGIGLLGNAAPRVLSPFNGKTGKMKDFALEAFSLLHLRDYALIHFTTEKGKPPRLSGVSPNPELSPRSPLALCAEAEGLSYPALIDEIVAGALSRGRQ